MNRQFESTVSVKRDGFSDDRLGVFKPMFAEMGHLSRQHPDELVFTLLRDGFSTLCFDGQNFFDTDHPMRDGDGLAVTVSNIQDGVETPWYLLDTTRAVRPIVWQERDKYDFQRLTAPNDAHIFMNDEYLFGVWARVNAGFGLWHLAYASRAPLNEENYSAARAAMMMLRGDKGRLLGVNPATMVVPPSLENAAQHVLNTEMKDGGGSNPWKGTASLIVTPYVAE